MAIDPLLRPREKEGRVPEPSKMEKRRLLAEMFREQDGICYLCEKRMRWDSELLQPVIEHVEPGKMGGCKDWNRNNLRAAHAICNGNKGSRRGVLKVDPGAGPA